MTSDSMRLKLIDGPALDLVASWMARKENYQWLDFGGGVQLLSPVNLKIITQRDSHSLRVFTSDTDDTPIGLVALSNIARNFQTASLWYVLGDKGYRGQGYTTRAVSEMLTMGFEELALEGVNAWTVESNEPSIQVLTRNHFQLVGRQRRCHWIDARPFDRLLFDVLRTDHKPV
jgi:RimJ/RimL family protein N-acetyltransferase